MGSFGDSAKKNDDSGFHVLGGTLLVEAAVAPERLEALYAQVKAATKRGVLDGYAEAATEIAAADEVEPGSDDGPRR